MQDGAMVAAGQPLARLANPTLKLDVLTREAQIAGQLGDVSGQDLGIERNRLDRASQIAQANYDLIKARREFGIRQQLHDQGFVSDAGVKSFAEETAYQEKRLAQLQSGGAAEARITATQAARLADTRGRLSGNYGFIRLHVVPRQPRRLLEALINSHDRTSEVGKLNKAAEWR